MYTSLTPKTSLRLLLLVVVTFVSSILSSQAALESLSIKGKKYYTLRSIKTHYGFPQMAVSGNKIALRNAKFKLEFTKGSGICYMNGVKFGLSSSVTASGGRYLVSELDVTKMIDPVLKPNYITTAKSFRTVIIDAGHGGKDAGAVNRYGTEAQYNLQVARTLEAGLKKNGFNVIMTRSTDKFLSLKERVNIANRYPNAIFISIHFNAASNSSAKGIETFTLSPAGVAHYGRGLKSSDFKTRSGNYQDSANIALATAIHGYMKEDTERYKILDRGIKRARFSVLSGIKNPAILIEGGFMSNPTEARLINDTVYRRTIATAIFKGIYRYRGALNSK